MCNVAARFFPTKWKQKIAMQEAFFKAFDKLNTFRTRLLLVLG
jgi:hypothetical protein